MHLEGHHLSPNYERHVGRKKLFLFGLAAACLLTGIFSVSRGAVSIPIADVVALFSEAGRGSGASSC